MKGNRIEYCKDELTWIEAQKTTPRRQAHAEFVRRFNRPDVSLTNFTALCKRKGWKTGRTGQFKKGQTSWSKGKKRPFNANSARTQFKKGDAPANRLPLWSERHNEDGYIEIKVPQRNPHTGHSTRFIHKHRYLWELENGPLPTGMCLKALDGDKTNTDPSNWKMIPRALLPRLNGRCGRDYENAAPEVKPLILATAQLEHAAREAKKR
ncbi:HNH endonuclease [Shimia thalassica]|uniref:HNH endonuclease n=1 Tax=Shimia thalassica TaxID=1715693 RepID=UPI0026E298B5|nr:HNH endonuclease [Shimia thalassica]MDO6523236.1 HNH endonuclease [Shimia thalassica]